MTPASAPIPGRDDFVLVPALCAARPGYALRAASLHLSRAAGCQTAPNARFRAERRNQEIIYQKRTRNQRSINNFMEKRKLPDFLIAGSAKSGTTSLFHYLNQHPNIYIPEVKECRFFSQLPKNFKGLGAEFFPNSGITNEKEYFKLFKGHEDKVCGDISNDYLYYYERSIENIKKYLGTDVKIIIILRNPVDRAYSNYMHAFRDDWENLTFEDAIIEETYRVGDNWGWPYHYVRIGFYYKQVKAYIDNFANIKIFLYDELKEIQIFMDNILSFLELETLILRKSNDKYNVSGYPKNRFIHKLVNNNDNKLKQLIRPFAKKILPEDFLRKLKNKNLERKPLNKKTRLYLEEIYSRDIKKLSILIKKDLSHWIKNEM